MCLNGFVAHYVSSIMFLVQAVVGVVGFAGVIFRWHQGVYALAVGYNVFLVSSFVALCLKWIEWTMAMGGNAYEEVWEPRTEDKAFMVIFTLDHLFIYTISVLGVVGMLRSTRMVIKAGGTGWEFKNYKEVRDTQLIQDLIYDDLNNNP
eukprot:Protomagalhaensia_sp_Gyna_25__2505@NODE_2409_length_1102_cov_4_773283_g1996_i0_p1_GENE_NODE_2409_length_1102_cov_4_773283_g1996_i0NODE_2409_length_1102_cov_4_773283_g1996_i0_p1_ORF_typecomplete_len149_score18_99MTABC_N/PF16185_5/0_81Cytochrom_B558a/PF05038_13/1_6_NODE_2409_length_1102_cov_4_773283_g1996_i0506952